MHLESGYLREIEWLSSTESRVLDVGYQGFIKVKLENNETKVRQINPDNRNAEQSFAIKNAVGETHCTESRWAPMNHILEAVNRKATNGFSKPKSTTL